MKARNIAGGFQVDLVEQCLRSGFLILGGFAPVPEDAVPEIAPGMPARSLFLIGSTGPGVWPEFAGSPEFDDGKPDPLDRFTRRVLSVVAHGFKLSPVFSFDGPPYRPFQQWALKATGFSQSPLGVLAHETYGPWAAFRAVFLSADDLGLATGQVFEGPCRSCAGKPCLGACPVNAISTTRGYDVSRCRDHLANGRGETCFSGCLARHACPFGSNFRQSPEQARFHMTRFVGSPET